MDSYFEKGVRLKGTLWVKGLVHFDGDLEGEVFSTNQFIVGQNGKMLGNIKTRDCTNMGTIQGNIFAENKVGLMKGSHLNGDISTYHLVVDEGSNFEGRCKMIDEPPQELPEEARRALNKEAPVPKGELAQPETVAKKPRRWNKNVAAAAVGVLMIGGIALFYPGLSGDGINSRIEKGYKLIKESRFSDAEVEFKKALDISRVNPQVYAGLGEVYLSKNRYNEALAQFRRSIELKPSNTDYRIKLASAYSAKGQFKEAEEAYKAAIKIDPKNYLAFYFLSQFYLERGSSDQALESLKEVVRLKPDFYQAHRSMSEIYSSKGDYANATSAVREAIKYKEDDASLLLLYGKLLMENKQEDKAVEQFKKAVKLFPKYFQAQVRLADGYFRKGMLNESLESYKAAESLQPNNPAVQARLGKIYSDKRKTKQAISAYENAIKLDPEDAESRYQLGKILLANGNLDRAQTELERAHALRKDHTSTRFQLGKLYQARGDLERAENQLLQVVETDPKNVEYLMVLGDVLADQKKLDEALERVLAAAQIEPENYKTSYAVCTVYAKKGYFTTGITHCEKALELNAKNYDTMNRLAWLYAKKRINLDKGIQLSQTTLKAFPKRPEYIDTLSELLYVKGDTDQAIKNIQVAIQLMPDEPYYKQQLWKFKNVKPKAKQ